MKIAIIGMGYVGLPLAVNFDEVANVEVIGFDINQEKIDTYKNGIDITEEVGNEAIQKCKVKFTCDVKDMDGADYFIVAIPTPINQDKTPDLTPLEKATEMLGKIIKKDAIIVYESTVYPGVTEDICVPILEKESNLKAGVDFKVGYSPERINPGDKTYTLRTIVKVVSGMDAYTLDKIAALYELIIEAGVYRAESIKVAEAAKVVENSQRDINIAFMNEIAVVFNKMGINTKSVVDAMATKWNALNFTPGLVGGHCIGVDPYYFIYKAECLGYHSQIILSARQINDGMAEHVAQRIIKFLSTLDKPFSHAKVGILGITFKEDCPDTRNSKIFDVVNYLKDYSVSVRFSDCMADPKDAMHEYGVQLEDVNAFTDIDLLIIAAPHEAYRQMTPEDFKRIMGSAGEGKLVFDVKNKLDKNVVLSCGYNYQGL